MKNYFTRLTSKIVDPDSGKLTLVPDSVILLSLYVSINALFQAIIDFVIEALSLAGFILKLPVRVEFMFLTVISAVLGYFTLQGLRRREIDVTRNSLILSLLVEASLVTGDWYFVSQSAESSNQIDWIRLPFMLVTFGNILIVLYIMWRTKIFNIKKYPLKY